MNKIKEMYKYLYKIWNKKRIIMGYILIKL